MLQQRKGLQQQQQQQQHWDPVKKQLLCNEDTSPSKWNRKKKTKYGDVLLVIVKERANKNILLLLLVILFSLYQITMHTNKSFIRMPISLNHHSHHPTDCGVQLLKKGRNHKRTQPRVFGYYFEDATPTDGRQWKKQPKRLRVYDDERYPSKRRVKPMLDKKRVEYIQNSQHYTNNTQWNKLRPYRNHPECQPMYDWQESTTATIISNCNTMHEQHVLDLDQLRNVQSQQGRLINGGYFRNVWRIKDVDGTSSLIMKTLQLYLNYTEWIYERHRIDARIMERMTSSPHIMDIYGYCGQASIVEYGPDGDIEDWLWKNPDRASRPNLLERLRIAVQITQAITDLHTYDSRNGYSAMVHADVMTNQFIYTKSGRFKLNDFNRAHFMYWNTTSDKNTTCPYIYPDYNAWTVRRNYLSIACFCIHNKNPHTLFLFYVCVCV